MTAQTRARRPRRLRSELIAVVVVTAIALAVVLGVVSTFALHTSLRERLDESLLAASQRGQAAPPVVGPGDFDQDGGDPPGLQVRGTAAGTVVLEMTDGVVTDAGYLDAYGGLKSLTPEQIASLKGAGATPQWVNLPGLGQYRSVATQRPDSTVVVTALPWQQSAETLRSYLLVEVGVSLVAVVIAAVVAALLVRRSLRPLDRVARTAHRVSELTLDRGDVRLTERVPPADTDERTEVGTVGASLNRLLGHVESSLASRHASETKVRQFVADASHELRTPLASIRGYTELMLRHSGGTGLKAEDTTHALERVAAESRRMQALVEDLLLLARLDQGRELELTDIDLVAIVADVTADAHVAGPDHEWLLEIPPDELPLVPADEPRLRQVLVNLAANARVHTPPGTRVTLAVAFDGDAACLSVTDNGPGIAPDVLPVIFDRFARGENSRTRYDGETRSGLGLAIAEAIVHAHEGDIAVTSRPGHTQFRVRLPLERGTSLGAEDGRSDS